MLFADDDSILSAARVQVSRRIRLDEGLPVLRVWSPRLLSELIAEAVARVGETFIHQDDLCRESPSLSRIARLGSCLEKRLQVPGDSSATRTGA